MISMAIRKLRYNDDPILRKKAREITEINDRMKTLAADMLETMYHDEGVGLAAPQVGILRRMIVIDVGQGPITMINPVIVSQKGSIVDIEGCLSFPDDGGYVERPEYVTAQFTDLEGRRCEVKGHMLLARAICHEIDHLNGEVFIDKKIPNEEAQKMIEKQNERLAKAQHKTLHDSARDEVTSEAFETPSDLQDVAVMKEGADHE
jgi:peptide deformylase